MAQPVGALLPHAPPAARAPAQAVGSLSAQPSDGLSQVALQPNQGSLGAVEKHSGAASSQPSGIVVMQSLIGPVTAVIVLKPVWSSDSQSAGRSENTDAVYPCHTHSQSVIHL